MPFLGFPPAPVDPDRRPDLGGFASGRSGFTLVEILVVVGIVAILGALTIPVLASSIRKQDDVVCLSNLRQIGLGIQLFAADNNGNLPGPLYIAQYPWYNDPVQLCWQLTNYLPVDRTTTKYKFRDVFVCPAFRKSLKKLGNAPVYALNINVPMGADQTIRQPYGYPNRTYTALFGDQADFPVMKLHQLAEIVDTNGRAAAASTWMLKDIDQEDPWLQSLPLNGFANFPKTKVHRDHRNALFYDFHVESVDRNPAK